MQVDVTCKRSLYSNSRENFRTIDTTSLCRDGAARKEEAEERKEEEVETERKL